jgi:histidinol-phosphatase
MGTYKEDVAFASQTALLAGEMMRFYSQGPLAVETKPDGTPVTRADKAVNRLSQERVQHYRPNDYFLGEESHLSAMEQEDIRRGDRVWVCDPIDGTWLYAKRVPVSVYSLALSEDRRPVVGVVCDPWTRRLFTATVGSDAIQGSKQLRVNASDSLEGACLTLPGSPVRKAGDGSVPFSTAELKASAINLGADTVTFGSVIYDAMLVATGFAAGHIYPYSSPWDMAAVKVIVEAAGGKVTDLTGQDQPYDTTINGAIVSNGLIHDQLVDLVARHAR